jgi:hypothetical protein
MKTTTHALLVPTSWGRNFQPDRIYRERSKSNGVLSLNESVTDQAGG